MSIHQPATELRTMLRRELESIGAAVKHEGEIVARLDKARRAAMSQLGDRKRELRALHAYLSAIGEPVPELESFVVEDIPV